VSTTFVFPTSAQKSKRFSSIVFAWTKLKFISDRINLVVIHFPLEFIIGQPIPLLLGFTNRGDKSFNVTYISASLRYPGDWRYIIQNVSISFPTILNVFSTQDSLLTLLFHQMNTHLSCTTFCPVCSFIFHSNFKQTPWSNQEILDCKQMCIMLIL
jgi:hypothetical protein